MEDPRVIESTEYWAEKDSGVFLYMFRKRLVGNDAPAKKPVLLLVHGSSECGRTAYDLTVVEPGDYSMMNFFCRLGYDVWTLDHEGYGRSSRTERNSDLESGASDLAVAYEFIERVTGVNRMHIFGQSSGALRAALFAERYPERLGRLVLDAFVYKGTDSRTLSERRRSVGQWVGNSRRKVDREFYHGMFTRDRVGTTDDAVIEAFARAELALDDSVPTGTYIDMCTKLPVNKPEYIYCPVMITRGEFDGIASLEDVLEYFVNLSSNEKQVNIIPGVAHVTPLSKNRQVLFGVVQEFLSRTTVEGGYS